MPDSSTKGYLRLENDDSYSESASSQIEVSYIPKHKQLKKIILATSVFLLLLTSILLNVHFFLRSSEKAMCIEDQGECKSKWAHLVRNVTTPIYSSTKYGPAYSTTEELDHLWDALDVSTGLVRISSDWALENGLPLSNKFPWDQSQGMYYLGAFHQIHCLKEIYSWISHMKKGTKPKSPYEHILHCMDNLLQDVYCHADDTPWYQLPPEPYRKNYAKFQTRQCKNWEGLVDWAQERSSCFHYNVLDDNGEPVKNQFEHYRFCPEGSPYTQVMERYFERKAAKEAQKKAMEVNQEESRT